MSFGEEADGQGWDVWRQPPERRDFSNSWILVQGASTKKQRSGWNDGVAIKWSWSCQGAGLEGERVFYRNSIVEPRISTH